MDAQVAVNGDGDYALGFTVDGAFIPLSTVASHRVAHLIERQATLKARADDPSHEGHGPALDAIEVDWKVATSGSGSSSTETPPSSPDTSALEERIAALEAAGTQTETTSTETTEA